MLAAGCSSTPPYSFPVNTYIWFNGPHQVVATAYDATDTVVATSSPVQFVIANSWPVTCNPAITVTTGTPVASTWSGQVTASVAMTGACAGDSLHYAWYVDGIQVGAQASTTIDTTAFFNGTPALAVVVTDSTNGQTYVGGQNYGAAEWSRSITFSNTGGNLAGAEVWSSARDIFITPTGAGSTYTLTPKLMETDQTVGSVPTFYYYDAAQSQYGSTQHTTINGTVSSPTTVISGTTAAIAGANLGPGADQIMIMAPTHSGTNATSGGLLTYFTTSEYAMGPSDAALGRLLVITGGANCVVGTYQISNYSVNVSTPVYTLTAPGGSTPIAWVTTTGTSHCQWALGPTRTVYAEVNPTNPPIPHFGNDGTIITGGYVPGRSMFMNEVFFSATEFYSQPYPVSMLKSWCQGGFNTAEMGVTPGAATSWSSSQSSFTTTQNSYISTTAPFMVGSACPKMRIFGTGDNIFSYLYPVTQGPASPLGSWTTPGASIIFSGLKAAGFIAVSLKDEINVWGQNPLQGPTRPGAGTIQNWLTSITSAGTSGPCTANTTATTPGGMYSMLQSTFAITGSSVTGLNSAAGTYYTVTPVNSTSFNFNCTGVAAGTYTDPGTTIQTLSAGSWSTPVGGGNSVLSYDAWANAINQVLTSSSYPPFAGSQKASTNLTAVRCWENVNGCGQSITVGGHAIANISDWADIYSDTEAGYLASRSPLNSLISGYNTTNEGNWYRTLYGAYAPEAPLTAISSGTSEYFDFDGYPVSMTSCTGNTITTSAPHGITNILPGVTRAWGSGSTDPNCNKNFYIIAAPTPTTLTVVYAQTLSAPTQSTNGGTLTFQNCTANCTWTLNAIVAQNAIGAWGAGNAAWVDYSSGGVCTATDNFNRNRGRYFTVTGVTGTGASYFNSTTFFYAAENPLHAVDGNSSASCSQNLIREVPVLSGTGGTLQIVPDNLHVRGREASTWPIGADPDSSFVSEVEAFIFGAAGTRFYGEYSNPQAYSPTAVSTPPNNKVGWLGPVTSSKIVTFGRSGIQGDSSQQLMSHPSVEEFYSVPQWAAGSNAGLMAARLVSLDFQTKLNSPDYGKEIDCGARSGSNGGLLVCLNASNGPQTRTFQLSAFETSGQNIVRYRANKAGIQLTVLAAGTVADTITLNDGEAVFYAFPEVFASWLQQISLAVRLADVSSATDVVVRYNYDLYNLDSAYAAFDCGGSGFCTLPSDEQIGPLYYRLIYRSASGVVLAVSDIQTL